MKIIIRGIACALTLFTLLSLFSCNVKDKAEKKSHTFYGSFDTEGRIIDYSGLSDKEFSALCASVEAELYEYHKLYDIYNEYDGLINLATVNRHAGGEAICVDKKITDLLLFGKEIYAQTNGEVNLAMGAVLRLWHEHRTTATEPKTLPSNDELLEAAAHTDINSVIINAAQSTVQILDAELSIDVGALAKGYAVEAVASRLSAEGYRGIVLDVGGNLRAVGEKPSGEGWTAGIRNPDFTSMQTYVYTLKVKNAALVTSGSYERFYTVDGVNYHHIIDKDTLMPAREFLSVSVLSPSSAASDAYSTAIFNMSYGEACEFIEQNGDIFAVLVLASGEVVTLGEAPSY